VWLSGIHVVSAFAVIGRRVILPRALLPSTRQPQCHECRSTPLLSSLQNGDNNNDNDNDDDDETDRMQQLYRQAMEDDKEWFDQFVVGVLGEDAVATVVSNNFNNMEPSEGDITSSSTNNNPTTIPSNIDTDEKESSTATAPKEDSTRMQGSKQKMGNQGEEPTFGSTRVTTGSRTVPNERVERPPIAVSEENDIVATEVTRRRKRVAEERSAETENIVTSTDIPADIKRVLENVSEVSAMRDKEQQNASRSPTSANTSSVTSKPDTRTQDDDEKEKEEPSLEEYWVRYRDAYNSKCSVPLQTVLQLGYTTQEIRSLQADALDLIVTDGIPKPNNGGVPLHWQIKADADREVRVGRPRPKPNTEDDDNDDDAAGTTAEPSSQRRERRDSGSSSRREGRRRTRSSVPRPREGRDEQSMWFDNDSEDPSRNKFWMDLPEFRDYLKREAELRLRILGPDWRDWIKTESDWRYALYKDWLWLLEDGVGEPIVGEPKPSRRTNSNSKTRPRPSSSSSAVGDANTERRRERTRPRQGDSMGNDIRMDDSRKQPQRRTERRQRNLDRDGEDADDTENTVSRQTRRRSRDTDESSSSEPNRRARRRPPRPRRSIDDDDNVEGK